MKKIVLILLLLFISVGSHAQTWNEWTRQRKTQIKYMLKQIAGLQTYIGYVQKGYEVAQKGLTMIGTIKDGDFKLHQYFIDALHLVKPNIKDHAKLPETIALQISMISAYQKSIKRIRQSDQLTQQEIDHIVKVSFRLIDAGIDNITELIRVIASDEYVMKDDERIQRIDALHLSIRQKSNMMRSFCNDNTLLVMQRTQEKNEVNVMRKLYKVK